MYPFSPHALDALHHPTTAAAAYGDVLEQDRYTAFAFRAAVEVFVLSGVGSDGTRHAACRATPRSICERLATFQTSSASASVSAVNCATS